MVSYSRKNILDTKFDLMSVLWFFIIIYLFVDCITGFAVQSLSIDIKLSQILKASFLLIFIVYITKKNLRVGLFFFLLLIWLLINSIIMVFSNNFYNAISFDIPSALRVILVPLSTVFFCMVALKNTERFLKNVRYLVYFSFVLLAINVLIGYAGYGFYTYPGVNFGFKGFFFAGNELSALFVLFSSFILFEIWNKRLFFKYSIFSILSLIIGISIGTKSTFIFSALAIFLIPYFTLLASGRTLIAFFWVLFLFLFLFLFFSLFFSFFQDYPLYSKILWSFENNGLMGILLSGRDEFLADFFSRITDAQGFNTLIFGVGSGLAQYQFKTIEIDFFDLAMYFGFPIAFLFLVFAFFSILIPLLMFKVRPFAPLIFLINIIFFFLAFLSGHIWNSGMLGISWGAINALLVIRDPLIVRSGK